MINQRNTIVGFFQKFSVRPCKKMEIRLARIPSKSALSYSAFTRRHDFIEVWNINVNNHAKAKNPGIPAFIPICRKILCECDSFIIFLSFFFFAFVFFDCSDAFTFLRFSRVFVFSASNSSDKIISEFLYAFIVESENTWKELYKKEMREGLLKTYLNEIETRNNKKKELFRKMRN